MFSRLLVKSTIICSVGVCAVRFANSQRGGSETREQTGVRFTTLAFAANRPERPTSKDPYKSFQPTELNSIDSLAPEIRMDYKEEADIIAKKAYNIYKSTDWKVAKASVSLSFFPRVLIRHSCCHPFKLPTLSPCEDKLSFQHKSYMVLRR